MSHLSLGTMIQNTNTLFRMAYRLIVPGGTLSPLKYRLNCIYAGSVEIFGRNCRNFELVKFWYLCCKLQCVLTVLVAKLKACLQPEKTHGYQYLFAVQFFNSYVYRGRINKGYLGGLDKVFKIRDRHHRIGRQILR